MPSKPGHPCLISSCPRLAPSGQSFCAEHAAEKKAEFEKKSREGYKSYNIYDAEWRKFRTKYLKMHDTCVKCGDPATVIDHIIPISRGGGKYDLSNLEALCHRCHSSKTASNDGGFNNRRKR